MVNYKKTKQLLTNSVDGRLTMSSSERMTLEDVENYKSKFEKIEELGRGKFGVVYKVKNVENDSYSAAKYIR